VAARQDFESRCITAALAEAEGNVSQAARLLGIDRTNLHKKIQAYDLGGGKGDGEDGS
jgi:two-component system nitrogen regulation response regulator NtrX